MKVIKFTEEDFLTYGNFFQAQIGRCVRIHVGSVGKCIDVKVVSVNSEKKVLYYQLDSSSEVDCVSFEKILGYEAFILNSNEDSSKGITTELSLSNFQKKRHPVFFRNRKGELTAAKPFSKEAGYAHDPDNGNVLTKL